MSGLVILNATEQVAAHLREELIRGVWRGLMPGGDRLATDFGVGRNIMDAALLKLEKEGLLESRGARRQRRIVPPVVGAAVRPLRVALLLWDASDRGLSYILDLQMRLTEAGHNVVIPRKTLMEMKMDLGRVSRLVEQTESDAWVVVAGSLEVLEWFCQQNFPTFAIFGRFRGLPMAAFGQSKQSAVVKATKSLIDLGHRSIVMLIRRQNRLPTPGISATAFWETLNASGIPNSQFSLPDWEESATGFQDCLHAIFQLTPPTALIVDELQNFIATCLFLARRGIRIPEDVSLIYTEADPIFAWCVPSIAHIRVDYSTVSKHILRWAKNMGLGKKDIRQSVIATEYIPGGTVGMVPTKIQHSRIQI